MTTISPEPIRTIYLHVRSKDCAQLTPGFNTDMSIDLLQAVQAASDEVIDVTMISAAIPHSFYPISAYLENDTIVYDTTETLTLPAKFYDPWELVRVINADTAFNAIFTCSYDIYTNKLSFTNTTGISHVLNWSTSGAKNPLGYLDTADEIVLAAGVSSSTDMVDLATIHSIIIRSDMSQGNVLTTSSGGLTVLQVINVNVDPMSIIYLDQTDLSTVSLSHAPAIDRISFRFEDQNGKLLDLQNRRFEFSIRFHIHKLIKTESVKTTPTPALPLPIPAPLPSPALPSPLPLPAPVLNPNRTIGETLQGVNQFVTQQVPIEQAVEETILDALLG
jgi:hypothetical protein